MEWKKSYDMLPEDNKLVLVCYVDSEPEPNTYDPLRLHQRLVVSEGWFDPELGWFVVHKDKAKVIYWAKRMTPDLEVKDGS